MLRIAYHSKKAENASEYARLKLAMDYWCSLWFWPIDQADLLPTRSQYLTEMSLILTGEVPQEEGFTLMSMDNDQPTLMDTMDDSHERDYMYDHTVDLDELCKGDGNPHKRLRLVKEIAKKQRFFHWELEFADVFKDGGFDFMVGNPPWVNVQWSETDAVSDANPYFAIHKLTASDLSKRMGELLKNARIRTMYLWEYVNIAGALAFYGSAGNYPLLQGRTNLFRCFLPNAWSYTRAQNGVSAFVHPDEVYADTKAPLLEEKCIVGYVAISIFRIDLICLRAWIAMHSSVSISIEIKLIQAFHLIRFGICMRRPLSMNAMHLMVVGTYRELKMIIGIGR